MEYRREIDGLRALAVIPVILFHAGFTTFSGGFIGVDVFFVISGYLITSILLLDLQAGTFSLVNFYERRARRILPALFIVMLACLPFAWFWLVPNEFKALSRSLMAVPLYVANILFARKNDYFDTTADLNPLLHTWSLSVEEQYYLIFPLLLLLCWKLGKRWVGVILSLLAVASFLYAQWNVLYKPTSTFYLLQARCWELLIGALIGLYLFKRPRPVHSKTVGEILSITGFVLILYAVFVFDRDTPFPSWQTLVPILGTTLIVLYARSENLSGRLLGSKAMVGIGLISYSLYLWHQPLFAFARHRSTDLLSSPLLATLALVSAGLAYISWKYIETPFRDKRRFSRKHIFIYGTVGSALFILIGAAGYHYEGFAFRNPIFQQFNNVRTIKDSRCHNELNTSTSQITKGEICTLGAGNLPTFAVIGDSHAGAIFEQIAEQVSNEPVRFFAISGGFCVPILNFHLNRYQPRDCVARTAAAYEQIIKTETIKDVILVAQWATYTKGFRDDGNGRKNQPALASDMIGEATHPERNRAVFDRALARSVRLLQSAGKNVIIVKPVPEFPQLVMDTIAKHALFSNVSRHGPIISTADYYARNREVLDSFSRLAGVDFIETSSLFCHEVNCFSADHNNRPYYSDTNHVTEYGARMVARAVIKKINARSLAPQHLSPQKRSIEYLPKTKEGDVPNLREQKTMRVAMNND